MSTQVASIRFGNDAERKIAQTIVNQLKNGIGADRFELWFGDSRSVRIAQSPSGRLKVTILADSPFSIKRLQTTFGNDINQIIHRSCGPDVAIEYSVEATADVGSAVTDDSLSNETVDPSPRTTFETKPQHQTLLPLKDSGVSKPKPDLQRHWFGSENRIAEAAVTQLVERPGQFSPLLVHGPTGCGKSHLLEAITHAYRRRLRLRRCVMLSAEQFTSLFVASLRGGQGLPMFRRKYRDLDLLVIDDVQFLEGKRATLTEFQHTVDHLIRSGKQIVISSDRTPLELSSLGSDLNTRLTGGLICPLQYPSYEGRLQIARQFCTERNISVSSDAIEMVCQRLTRDIRRISGALNRLHALSLSTGKKISGQMAQSELGELFALNSRHSTSISNIESAVCEFCGVKPSDLKSGSRQKQVSSARMLAMYLSRQHTTSAFSEIGDYFGGRSHSTVIAAQKKVNTWLESNAGVSLPNATWPAKDVISRLESNLRVG